MPEKSSNNCCKSLFDRSLSTLAKALAAVLVTASLTPGGCASGSSPEPGLAQEGRAVFGAEGRPGSTESAPAWRIVLAAFSGPDAVQRAQAALPIVQGRGGVPEAIVEPRRRGAVIAVGAFDDPASRAAQRELARVRAIEVDGRPAYPTAFLAPPEAQRLGSDPELDLATARERFGQSIRYTLQVGVYESDRRAEAARAAEEAAATYRRDGELAFYYHGPNRSMVTIGLFTERDYDPQSGRMSDELRALMSRHPKHLYNGMGVRQRLADGSVVDQAPRLVRVP